MAQRSRWLLNARWPHTPVTAPRKQGPSSGVCIRKLLGAFGMRRGLRLGWLPVLKVKGYPPSLLLLVALGFTGKLERVCFAPSCVWSLWIGDGV